MKIYLVMYKEKCFYTGLPIGETLQEEVAAETIDHLLYLCDDSDWHVISYQRIA